MSSLLLCRLRVASSPARDGSGWAAGESRSDFMLARSYNQLLRNLEQQRTEASLRKMRVTQRPLGLVFAMILLCLDTSQSRRRRRSSSSSRSRSRSRRKRCMGPAQHKSQAPFEHVQVAQVFAGVGKLAVRHEHTRVTRNRFEVYHNEFLQAP